MGDYNLEYLLVGVFVFLGLVLVCVPRPRKRTANDHLNRVASFC